MHLANIFKKSYEMACLQPIASQKRQILIGFDVINNWDTELKEMNKDKVGEPFHYPNTFLLLLEHMLNHIFIFHTGKPKALHKDMLKKKIHSQSQIVVQ
jgi:hypothetical protein